MLRGRKTTRENSVRSSADPSHEIDYRVTQPRGKPSLVVIFQLGTLSEPKFGDLIGKEMIDLDTATTYAVAARTAGAPNFTDHADDLNQIIEIARLENPESPIVVMGVSFGAAVALEWDLRHNQGEVPVAALSPVIMSRLSYLGPKPLARIAAGMFSRRIAAKAVASPVSAGIQLTTNPKSMEFGLFDPDMTVPASLFGDMIKMLADVTTHPNAGSAPLFLACAGNDRVAYQQVTELWSKVFRSRNFKMFTAANAAHDLSQETNNRDFMRELATWAWNSTRGKALS